MQIQREVSSNPGATLLTTEQACGQKMMLAFEGTEPSAEILEVLQNRHAAGVTLFRSLNIESPAQLRDLTGALQEAAARTGQPPLLIAADQEGGQLMAIPGTTQFPGNMALGATGSFDLARKTGRALGRELAAMGVNINYAPVCDVNTNPQNPNIGIRSFGDDPASVARFAAAIVEGLQAEGVAATAKHYPGLGEGGLDSHYGLPILQHDRARVEQVELVPFGAAVAAGVRLFMTGHVALPNLNDGVALPATLSRAILTGMLRDQMGFEGVIISDAMNMGAIEQGPGLVVDAIAAVAAGVDLLLCMDSAEAIYSALVHAARRLLLPTDAVHVSAGRVLALKRWLAEQPRPSLDVVNCAEHRDLALETAGRSLTLVRDEARLLPLRLPPSARVAVVVPESADLTPADTSSYVKCGLADALRQRHAAVDEFVVPHTPSDADVAQAREAVRGYDLVVVGTINAAAQSAQPALVNAILNAGVPTITVALRLPYDLQAYPSAPTYVCTYSILEPSISALVRALWGDTPFTGRLPVSIPGLYPRGHGLSI